MQEQRYRQQVNAAPGDIELDFWREAEGIAVPDDELRFLLVPDAVEAAAVDEVAAQVHAHQARGGEEQITRALIVTMGGMLPGVLLYDHLVEGRRPGDPAIEFGTVGVSLYQGPGVRYEHPTVEHGISVDLRGHNVLLIDDLVDLGGTMGFLRDHVLEAGARRALSLVLYMKPTARETCPPDFCFGTTAQDTWIITPRERVETMVKRVPVWKERGADQAECRRRLVDIIGYPPALVADYLPGLFVED